MGVLLGCVGATWRLPPNTSVGIFPTRGREPSAAAFPLIGSGDAPPLYHGDGPLRYTMGTRSSSMLTRTWRLNDGCIVDTNFQYFRREDVSCGSQKMTYP